MQAASVSSLTKEITIEILRAFGLPTSEVWQKYVGSWFKEPATRFSELFATFDHNIREFGIIEATRRLMPAFVEGATAYGVEKVPQEGPLLITGNHPGTVDGVSITANAARSDIKVVVGGMPFLMKLPSAQPYLIFTDRKSANVRANAVRQSIKHLEGGGAVLIFPTGQIDPDPAVLPGGLEALERWSRSIALMLRRVPETRLLTAITSGVLAEKFTKSPLTLLGRDGVGKRRIMEFIQVMRQLVFKEDLNLHPKVTFGEPFSGLELGNLRDTERVMREIVGRAKASLNEHLARIRGSEEPSEV